MAKHSNLTTQEDRVSCARSLSSLSSLYILSFFLGLSSSSAVFFCCTRTTALPTAQSRSRPQHVSRRWLELGQRWSIAGAVGWDGGKVARERESERAGVERALIALSLFARSFSLFVRLLWLSFYFGLHCGFAVVAAFCFAAAAAPKCNKRHQGYTLPQRCRRRSCCSCSCSAHWFRLQFINTLIRFHLLLVSFIPLILLVAFVAVVVTVAIERLAQ